MLNKRRIAQSLVRRELHDVEAVFDHAGGATRSFVSAIMDAIDVGDEDTLDAMIESLALGFEDGA